MKFLCLISTLFAVAMCGCESASNEQRPVTILPMVPNTAARQTRQPPSQDTDFYADQPSASAMNLRLSSVSEGRHYLDELVSTISKKCSAGNTGAVPRDTMTEARFKLHQDGSISDIVLCGSTNTPAAPLLMKAIKACSPLPRWSNKMRSVAGQESFVIYYSFGFNMMAPGP